MLLLPAFCGFQGSELMADTYSMGSSSQHGFNILLDKLDGIFRQTCTRQEG